jgi:hypothetical protein
LPPNDAIVRADVTRKRLIKENIVQEDSRDPYWVVSTIELTPYDIDRGLWYWVVQFETCLDASGPPALLRLIVLMDGTVVEPAGSPVVPFSEES